MAGIIVYGKPSCVDTQRSLKFLDAHRVKYRWVDVEKSAQGERAAREKNGGKLNTPTIVFGDGSALVEPSDDQLSRKLNIRAPGA